MDQENKIKTLTEAIRDKDKEISEYKKIISRLNNEVEDLKSKNNSLVSYEAYKDLPVQVRALTEENDSLRKYITKREKDLQDTLDLFCCFFDATNSAVAMAGKLKESLFNQINGGDK